ncbi:branched-chain amino acid transport system II carrier protein [Lactobacillus sp. S2-2]|uniref:branched-chain amino acid transport system II carrier protein n=1 Tax=Lactobacillus sp. S2-2 TaxID=2692917 RepID=UPI001F02BC82|nr:branched-chain amino acid transport system II carrier protein [Lactobacillus sp. S2-2]MCF6515415.1 branched-chain amino acid transport system II carrier protein [Lactobacillus sp. S2-2]
MDSKLSKKNIFYLGIMLFGIFFGAGNVIFPISMGQAAGNHIIPAVIGFLITGVGLPILGIVAFGLTNSKGMFDLASNAGKPFAYFFSTILSLLIGPIIVIPRLAATAYQVGVAPLLKQSQQTMGLFIFAVIFFLLVWYLTRTPGNLLDYIGKFLTPIFLVLLAMIIIMALVKPMGDITTPAATGKYIGTPFSSGFIEGYNTLDGAGSIAIAIVVIEAIKKLGVKSPNKIASSVIKSGLISAFLMGLVYTLLALVGTMSLGKFSASENGGIGLVQIATYYFGSFGNLLLAVLIFVACLKTNVAMISAFGDTMTDMLPKKISYSKITVVAILVSLVITNLGLTQMINFAMPFLMFIYPLSIVLILLGIISPLIGKPKVVYQVTLLFALIPAIFSGLNATGLADKSKLVGSLLHLDTYLPFSQIGLSWVVPTLIGFILGMIIHTFKKRS